MTYTGAHRTALLDRPAHARPRKPRSRWPLALIPVGIGLGAAGLVVLTGGTPSPHPAPHPVPVSVQSRIPQPVHLVPVIAPQQYTVRSGDSWWSIARSQCGDGTQWRALASASPGMSVLQPGQLITVSCRS